MNAQLQVAGLKGETQASRQMNDLWQRFKLDYTRLLDGGLSVPARQELYNGTLVPEAHQLKSAARQQVEVSVADIRSAHGELHSMAAAARWTMHTVALTATAVAIGFSFLIGRFILRPVQLLTNSVHQVQQGRLDSAVPVRSKDELGGLSSAFNDMTVHLRQAKRLDDERLLRTQQTMQLAIDSLTDAVVVANSEGVIELTNRIAKQLFNLRPDTALDALPERRLADLHREVCRTGQAFQPNSYECAIRLTLDGRDLFFLPKGVPIIDADQRTIGSAIMLIDVTELHRLDEMKSGLLAMAAHELKTPLTSMRLILHLVAEEKIGQLTPKQKELLAAASEDSDRLHHILENLLDLGRIETGKTLMAVRPMPAGQRAKGVVEGLRTTCAERGLSLEYEAPASQSVVLADPARIGHTLANLLANAIRYTHRGGRICVTVVDTPDFVEFTVRDTGIGIPSQYLPRVFEKFFRVPGQSGDTGSGLGLAIVKSIIEAHGGRVVAESVEGRGSVFRFTLPHANTTQQEIDHGIASISDNGGQ